MMMASKAHESGKTGRKSVGSEGKAQSSETQQPNLLWQELATRVQTKLSVGAPNDPYEGEADQVADGVIQRESPTLLQRKCACGGSGTECDCGKEKRGQGALQRKTTGTSAIGRVPSIVHDVLALPGQPLASSDRAFFEPRLGEKLDHVRVHTDSQAAESARKVSALAYTVGQNLVFDTGRYAPQTDEGRRLLAHELVHVMQSPRDAMQSGPTLQIASSNSRQEAEANHMASRVLQQSGSVFVTPSSTRLYRQEPPGPPSVASQSVGKRRILMDANVIGQINRGNAQAAKTLLALRDTAEVYISQQAYKELTSQPGKQISGIGPDLPRTAAANRQLIQELNIKVAPAGELKPRVDVYEGNIVEMRGNISPEDLMHAGQAKAIDAELWTFDKTFRSTSAEVFQSKLGVRVAAETYSVPVVGGGTREDYRVARSLLGLPPVEITVGGKIKTGGGTPGGTSGGTPPEGGTPPGRSAQAGAEPPQSTPRGTSGGSGDIHLPEGHVPPTKTGSSRTPAPVTIAEPGPTGTCAPVGEGIEPPAVSSSVGPPSSTRPSFRSNLRGFAGEAGFAALNMLGSYLAAKAQEHFDRQRWESDMQRIQGEVQASVDKSATTISEIKSRFPGAKVFANISLRSTTMRTFQGYALGAELEPVDQTVYYGTELVSVNVSPCEVSSRSESVKREAPLLGMGGIQETYITYTTYSVELP